MNIRQSKKLITRNKNDIYNGVLIIITKSFGPFSFVTNNHCI